MLSRYRFSRRRMYAEPVNVLSECYEEFSLLNLCFSEKIAFNYSEILLLFRAYCSARLMFHLIPFHSTVGDR